MTRDARGADAPERELVDDGGLPHQDKRQVVFGILVELQKGVQFGKDFQP